MSFRTDRTSPGVLMPEELRIVERVFKRIVLQSWFTRAPSDQQQFAAYVIRTYFRGLTDPDLLYDFCLAAAMSRHAHGRGLAKPSPAHLGRNVRVVQPAD